MADVKVGDRLEDHEGNVWTVADVFPDTVWPQSQVRLVRTQPVQAWAGLDEVGPTMKRYRPVTETTDV